MHATPRILDPCSGSRMMWFDRQSSDVIFGDTRQEEHTLCDGRLLKINPDVLMDFRNLPYTDNSFHLIAFDPPHLIYAGQKSWLALKYGKLEQDWREDLKQGFSECFRVLKENGVLCFKWNETQIKVREVLEQTVIWEHFRQESRHALVCIYETRGINNEMSKMQN